MKLGQSFCLDEILYIFENRSCLIKNRSLGKIVEDPVLVSKGLGFKSLLLNAIPHNPESSGEHLQGHHGPLVVTLFMFCSFNDGKHRQMF